MKTIQISHILDVWATNWKRFPLASLIAHIATFCIITLVQDGMNADLERNYGCALMASMIAFPLAMLVVAITEKRTFTHTQNYAANFGVIMIGLASYWLLDQRAQNIESWVPYTFICLLIASHFALASLPFLSEKGSENFWEFNRQMLAHFITGLIFSFLLWGGLSAALLALDKLFELEINYRMYPTWAALSWGLLSTGYFMWKFPSDLAFDQEEMVFDRAYLTITKYLFVPIAILYFAILYAYGIKILLELSLPKGWVSSLCIGFTLVGIFAWLLNYFLPSSHPNRFLAAFKRWFWPMIFPILILLFIGIGRRISEYGITEERYVVAMIAACLLANTLYFSFVPATKQRLWVLPLSVALFSLLTVIGPFNARNVSLRNQSRQLFSLLQKEGIWNGSNLTIPTTTLEVDPKIEEKLYFLNSRDTSYALKLLHLEGERSKMASSDGSVGVFELTNYLHIKSRPETGTTQSSFSINNLAYQSAYLIPHASYKLQSPTLYADKSIASQSGWYLSSDTPFSNLLLYKDNVLTDTISIDIIQKAIDGKWKSEILNQYYVSDTIQPFILIGSKRQVLFMPSYISGELDLSAHHLGNISELNGDFYLLEK